MAHYKKIIRREDKKIFYILDDEFLCSDRKRVLKDIKNVKRLHTRFRNFIIGID